MPDQSAEWKQILVGRGHPASERVISDNRVMSMCVSAEPKIVKSIMRSMIIIYKIIVSPFLGTHCRFYPSCSQYLLIAIERHGALRGLFLGACRLMRCNNFFDGGDDPVPEANGEHSLSIYCAKIDLFPKDVDTYG